MTFVFDVNLLSNSYPTQGSADVMLGFNAIRADKCSEGRTLCYSGVSGYLFFVWPETILLCPQNIKCFTLSSRGSVELVLVFDDAMILM